MTDKENGKYPCLADKNCPTYSRCYQGWCQCRDEFTGDGEECKPSKKLLCISLLTSLFTSVCPHLHTTLPENVFRSVAALVSCYCLVIVAAVIVLGLGALFLLFVVLFTLRACLHGDGGPQVGEVTRLAVVEKWPAFTCKLTTPGSRGDFT